MIEQPDSSKNSFMQLYVVSLLVLLIADGGLLLVPSNWRAGYVLTASLIMMAEIILSVMLRLFTYEGKIVLPMWISLGVANLCAALVLLLFNFSSSGTLFWMMGILTAFAMVTSLVLIRYLKNRKIIR